MKIFEITGSPILSFEQQVAQLKSELPLLGRGEFAYVFKTGDSPQRALKIAKPRVKTINSQKVYFESDGYFNYIQAIKNSQDSQFNPFLPQIDDLKIFKPPKKGPYFMVWLERLIPADQINIKSYSSTVANLLGLPDFTPSDIRQLINILKNDFVGIVEPRVLADLSKSKDDPSLSDREREFDRIDYHEYHREVFGNIITRLIENRGVINQIYKVPESNQHFFQAVDLVQQLASQFHIDIHQRNFMFRLTRFGAQLVLTDPLADLRK